MYTIGFNSYEKQKLLEILKKDNSTESIEFINRINSCRGFYSPDIPNDQFNYYGFKKEEYLYVDNGSLPSGMIIETNIIK